jgi:hypothetical protein
MTGSHEELPREQDIIQSLIRLADQLVDDYDVVDLTTELTEDCSRLLDVSASGVLLADAGGVLHLLAASSEEARNLEIFQLQREEGPCLDCFRTGEPVIVSDLRAERARWPRFVDTAEQQGFASVHAIPMRLQDDRLGALGLFGTNPGALDQYDLALARALAHVASIAIASRPRTRSSLLPGLQQAVASRGVLEMAKGVVAEVQEVQMDEAFTRLRRYARRRNQRLTELARTLISSDPEMQRQLLYDIALEKSGSSPPSG